MNRQACVPQEHPVYNPLELQLRTPEINRLHETLTQWLWTGATGGFIKGSPRIGKSTALEMLANDLSTRTKNPIPAHMFTVPPRDRPTIRAIYRNLCISADIDFNKTRQINSDILMNDFYHFLMDKARQTESKQVVLFVDEMQRLHIDQIEVFAELHDIMAIRKVLLTVIFTGNDTECEELLEAIHKKSRRHIYGRFFTQTTDFKGITSHKSLRKCLQQYDTKRYPEKDGPTYTQAFLADEFNNGFRLASFSTEIWELYNIYKRELGLTAWGMKYFSSAINVLLVDYLPRYGVDEFSIEMMKRCIDVSGLHNSPVTCIEL